MSETSLVILVVVFLLTIVFSPLILQIWRIAKNMTTALEELNKSLPGILKNLEHITTNLSSTTDIIQKELAVLSLLSRKIQGIVELGEDVERILFTGVKLPILQTVKTLQAMLKVVRVFFDVLSTKKGEPQGGKGKCQG